MAEDLLEGRDTAALLALLEGIDARVTAFAPDADDAALLALAKDVAIAADFAIRFDPYQRPDMYVFGMGLGTPAVGAFVDRVFARIPRDQLPSGCAGPLERLAHHHDRTRPRRRR